MPDYYVNPQSCWLKNIDPFSLREKAGMRGLK
jgi:hypothetical protein